MDSLGSISEFMRIHDEIDQEIKDQNARYTCIDRMFVISDLMIAFLIIGANIAGQFRLLSTYLLCSVLDALFALVLVICAVYLAMKLRKSTGHKPNVCLVIWHIVNVVLLTSMAVILTIYRGISIDADEHQSPKARFEFYATFVATGFVDVYVDLFLLYLLFKFTRPQKRL